MLKIDRAGCTGCGECVADCPGNLLEMQDGVPAFRPGRQKSCIGCQHCVMACPEAALDNCGVEAKNAPAPGRTPSPEQMLNLIRQRRSIRRYRPENLPPELLGRLTSMLKYSPTGVNDHTLHFAVVADREKMDGLRAEVSRRVIELFKKSPDSPLAAGLGRYRQLIEAGYDVFFRGAPHLIAVSAAKNSPCPQADPFIALSYFELYACTLGVGTTWCGLGQMIFRTFPDLAGWLGVPEGWEPGYTMLFGPPAARYFRGPQPMDIMLNMVK